MLLYNKHLDYPKHVCCKVIEKINDVRLNETKIMQNLCKKKSKGMVTYYHHIVSDKIYIFIEDCFLYKSCFEEILKIKSEGPEKVTNIPVGPKKKNLVNKNFKRNFFEIVEYLVESLREIHSKNYVHCDIAPKNILISNDNYYKIADFGSVVKNKHYAREFTPKYLDKEIYSQFKKKKEIIASPNMDYYALGKSLFEILTLEVSTDFSNMSGESVLKLISKSIRDKGLDSIHADIINDIMKMRFKSIGNYKTFIECKSIIASSPTIPYYSFGNEKKSFNECSSCKLLGSSYNKLISFACKHSFHKNCMYFHKELFICQVCGRFIGTNALKIYLNKLSYL